MSRLAPTSAVLAALALAACAPAAGAQVPLPDLPADPAAAGIPQNSAISEQYRAVEEAVAEALPAAPTPEPAPPAAPPEPVSDPAAPAQSEQYHSETPSNVSVTQDQPSNVNVSIRINSPGDDGPVVQINNAGGTAVVEQVVETVQRPAGPAPGAADPPPGALPETWEWVWTSACFGAAARAAAAVPGWNWRWSCDSEDDRGAPAAAPDAWPLSEAPGLAEVLAIGAPVPPFVAEPARSRRERATRARHRSGAVGAGGGGPAIGPPPVALARSLVAATAHAPAAVAEPVVREVVRAAARARPGRSGASLLFPLGEGPVAGATNALGTVASLLLGIWIAVLITAVALVLPRIRRRRWPGPAWRLTRGPSARLERPG